MRLIDADALSHKLNEIAKKDLRDGSMACTIGAGVMVSAIHHINEMPTVEAEPVRHGWWIANSSPDANANQWFICSECQMGDEHAKTATVPYCWHCGAKMDGQKISQ